MQMTFFFLLLLLFDSAKNTRCVFRTHTFDVCVCAIIHMHGYTWSNKMYAPLSHQLSNASFAAELSAKLACANFHASTNHHQPHLLPFLWVQLLASSACTKP